MRSTTGDELPSKAHISPLPQVRGRGDLGSASAFTVITARAMEALLAGVEDTVTDNGGSTYTHTLGAKDQP